VREREKLSIINIIVKTPKHSSVLILRTPPSYLRFHCLLFFLISTATAYRHPPPASACSLNDIERTRVVAKHLRIWHRIRGSHKIRDPIRKPFGYLAPYVSILSIQETFSFFSIIFSFFIYQHMWEHVQRGYTFLLASEKGTFHLYTNELRPTDLSTQPTSHSLLTWCKSMFTALLFSLQGPRLLSLNYLLSP
jgi:hypothetical protein